MNLAALIDTNIARFGEYVQWIFGEKEFTNVEANRVANKFANGLVSLGVKRGDRVMTLMRNCPEAIMTFMSTWKIGAVAVPTIFVLSPQEIAYNLQNSGAVVLVTDSTSYQDKIKPIRSEVPTLKNVIVVDKQIPDTIFFQDLVAKNSDQFKTVPTDDDDLALLLYTGGTTGRPKGVMQTHLATYLYYIGISDLYLARGENSRDLTSLVCMPLSHAFGLMVMAWAFVWGNKNIVMSFEEERALRAIEKHKVKLMSVVPTMVQRLLNYAGSEKYVAHGVNFDFGGAPLPTELVRAIKGRYANSSVTQGYGCTEVGLTQHHRAWVYDSIGLVEPELIAASVGPVSIPGVEVRIFDDNDKEAPIGEVGEIVVRGPQLMKGYWNNPELTAKAIRNSWYHTGDLGHFDKYLYLYIVGRKDDMIKRGGEMIYPAEVEDLINSHPKVNEVAVIGVPDPKYGSEVKAFIVLKKGETATADEIKEYMKGKITFFKIPKYIEFMDSLPKSSIGKILKRELRKQTGQK